MIIIITRKQKQDGLETNARLQYGSFNTQKYMGNVGYRKDKFSVFASINHDRTDGHRDTSDFRITNGYIKAAYQISNRFHLYTDFNLAGYQATRFMDIFLEGNNLLNQSYQINYGYPMPGINFMGGIHLRLSAY